MDYVYILIGIMLGVFCALNIFKVLDNKKFDDLLKVILIVINIAVFIYMFFTDSLYIVSFFGMISELVSIAIIYFVRRTKKEKKMKKENKDQNES